MEKPILVVHPKDKTTSFLSRTKDYLITSFPDQAHHFNIYPNEQSHQDCLRRISMHSEKGIIIFLGHGRSDRLYGSKGDLYENIDFISPDAVNENPSAYYYNDNFIHYGNSEVFSNKKIFCLACNSNNKIAEYALEKGAKSFLGFGDIPTSIKEFEEKKEKVTSEVVLKMKTEINYIIKKSMMLSISKGLTFEGLLDYIKLIANQRLTDFLINQKNIKERFVIADYLYSLKNEAKILGERKLKLLE